MILIENKPGHDGDHEVLSMITGQQDDDQKLKINAMKKRWWSKWKVKAMIRKCDDHHILKRSSGRESTLSVPFPSALPCSMFIITISSNHIDIIHISPYQNHHIVIYNVIPPYRRRAVEKRVPCLCPFLSLYSLSSSSSVILFICHHMPSSSPSVSICHHHHYNNHIWGGAMEKKDFPRPCLVSLGLSSIDPYSLSSSSFDTICHHMSS